MKKLWEGVAAKPTAALTDEFNSSLAVDKRMYAADIRGSLAHAHMLAKQGIISESDMLSIEAGLKGILSDIESGALVIENAEDIHMFVEAELTARVGNAGKRLHTARSRNDQVATDMRVHLSGEMVKVQSLIKGMISSLAGKAERYFDAVMPGYTHLQRAQPVTLGHHLLAYCAMLMRDYDRLTDCLGRTQVLPLGSCALAGTTYDIDRFAVAAELGFNDVAFNSMDGVSDRDFVIELAADLAMIMTHLSRLAEEVILWSGAEFGFVTLDDGYTTGSSIMPQKKNPDVAELVRGKTGRVYGNLMSILTVMKGLPLAYNKDMQEDKEGVFDSLDAVSACLAIFADMISSAEFHPEKMLAACKDGFINATDCADYLTKKGMPFRTAYKLTGELVRGCIASGHTLCDLPLADYKAASELFDEDIYEAVDVKKAAFMRASYGGPAPESVKAQIERVKEFLGDD